MPDPSPSTLTVLNSNFLQLRRRSGGRPAHSKQFTPVNCKTHCVSGNRTHNLPIVSPRRARPPVMVSSPLRQSAAIRSIGLICSWNWRNWKIRHSQKRYALSLKVQYAGAMKDRLVDIDLYTFRKRLKTASVSTFISWPSLLYSVCFL